MFAVGVELSDTCRALLGQAANFHPFYGDGLSDHVPMGLVALDRLGASPGRLNAFYRASIPSLVRLEPVALMVHPRNAMGDPRSFAGVRLHFQHAIVEEGPEVVLRRWLPQLVPGLAAASFHGLIRLGYAIETSNSAEIASALALWTTSLASLGPPGILVDETPRHIVKRLSQLIANHPRTPGLIVDRMISTAALNSLQYAAAQPKQLDLSAIAEFAISAYASFDDFTLLHAVTATHAFRLTLPFVADPALAMRYLWRSILVAALSSGVPLHGDWPQVHADLPDWTDIAARAVESDDEHVIKLVYTAFAESQKYSNPLYQFVAMRQAASDGHIALAG
jgi:hypothetical protein